MSGYEDFLAASERESVDGTWQIRTWIHMGENELPYVSANLSRLAIESAGSISLMFPNSGRPGGPGIGSVMTEG